MFTSEPGASRSVKHLSGGPHKGRLFGLTHKHQTGLKRLARDKYFKLLWTLVDYDHKKFHNIGPRYRKCDPREKVKSATISYNFEEPQVSVS